MHESDPFGPRILARKTGTRVALSRPSRNEGHDAGEIRAVVDAAQKAQQFALRGSVQHTFRAHPELGVEIVVADRIERAAAITLIRPLHELAALSLIHI